MEHSEENTDVLTGTLPAFRKTNAKKAAEIQRLVLNYRDTEERIGKLVTRHNDLATIESEIAEIIENDTIKKIDEKVEFLSESISTIKNELVDFDKKLNHATAEVY